jgi:hypothetical protein
MSKEAYADSLEHWAKCFRDGTLDDSFANEIAYLLEDKAADIRGDVQPTVTVTHAPTQEEWFDIAECIWVGALEGGSNHWIEYIHTGDNDLKSGVEIVGRNFEIVIHVEDYEPLRWYRKSFDVILDGITLLDSKRQAQVFEDIGQLDAYDYDLIIQLGTFGKEVFC